MRDVWNEMLENAENNDSIIVWTVIKACVFGIMPIWLKSSKRLFTPGRFYTIQYTFSSANNNAHFAHSIRLVRIHCSIHRQNAQNLISKHKFLTHTNTHIFKSFRILKNEIQSSISLPVKLFALICWKFCLFSGKLVNNQQPTLLQLL